MTDVPTAKTRNSRKGRILILSLLVLVIGAYPAYKLTMRLWIQHSSNFHVGFMEYSPMPEENFLGHNWPSLFSDKIKSIQLNRWNSAPEQLTYLGDWNNIESLLLSYPEEVSPAVYQYITDHSTIDTIIFQVSDHKYNLENILNILQPANVRKFIFSRDHISLIEAEQLSQLHNVKCVELWGNTLDSEVPQILKSGSIDNLTYHTGLTGSPASKTLLRMLSFLKQYGPVTNLHWDYDPDGLRNHKNTFPRSKINFDRQQLSINFSRFGNLHQQDTVIWSAVDTSQLQHLTTRPDWFAGNALQAGETLETVKSLTLISGNARTAFDLKHLSHFPQLEHFEFLSSAPLESFEYLNELKHLKKLRLENQLHSNEELNLLLLLNHLVELDIPQTNIQPELLTQFLQKPNLQKITFSTRQNAPLSKLCTQYGWTIKQTEQDKTHTLERNPQDIQ